METIPSNVLDTNPAVHKDVELIGKIPIIPSILEVICRNTGMGFACIARVSNEGCIACGVKDEIGFGLLPGCIPVIIGMELDTTICNEISRSGKMVVIENVDQDLHYQGHPASKKYGYKSYISVPVIKKDGSFFGTLFAMDPKPAQLNKEQTIGMFTLFADLVAFHLKALEDLEAIESKLKEEERNAQLREMFIAILGHDLRNPIGSILMATEIILQAQLDEETTAIVETIMRSAFRISTITENVLDFARSKIGNGISPQRAIATNLEHHLLHIVSELKAIYPGQEITCFFDLNEPVCCDSNQLGQLFSNLLNNAITHGRKGSSTIADVTSNKQGFKLTVSNYFDGEFTGNLEHLFQPIFRADNRPGKKGLGLGLYIASEIAKAHGGTMHVSTEADRISFSVLIPHPVLKHGEDLS
jgi:signal transduction histidine kinase